MIHDPTPRLTIVLSTALLGGTERQVLLYLRHVDRSRISPRVLVAQTHELQSPEGRGSVIEELQEIGVPYSVTPRPRFYHAAALSFLVRELSRPSDVTMLFGFTIAWIGRLLLWSRPGRVITGIRNANVHRSRATLKIEGLLSPFVDLYVSNSHAARDHYAQVASLPRDKITVIPNSLDIERLRSEVPREPRGRLRAELGLPDNALVGINVSNLRPRKGHIKLIEAVSGLSQRYPDFYLLLVGHDNSDGAVSRRIQECGLEDRILPLGFRRDVPALISGSDVMVHPSYSEGMSNSIMEGMALGLPVVASDVGDNRLLLEGSGGGVVCPAGDSGALTSALDRILAEEDRSVRWGGRGARFAAREFSVDAYVERTTRVVEILAAGGTPSHCNEAVALVE